MQVHILIALAFLIFVFLLALQQLVATMRQKKLCQSCIYFGRFPNSPALGLHLVLSWALIWGRAQKMNAKEKPYASDVPRFAAPYLCLSHVNQVATHLDVDAVQPAHL